MRAELAELAAGVDADDAAALAATSDRSAGARAQGRRSRRRCARILDGVRRSSASGRVAVRSSATSEDTAGTSFAGMHETFTNVAGADAARSTRVVDCWASLFGERVIAYRRHAASPTSRRSRSSCSRWSTRSAAA